MNLPISGYLSSLSGIPYLSRPLHVTQCSPKPIHSPARKKYQIKSNNAVKNRWKIAEVSSVDGNVDSRENSSQTPENLDHGKGWEHNNRMESGSENQ